ncbi:hypothetical protein A2617_01740 [Candidatus Daviesbacteria bacterium RIFOXYD1_FULL_41_10]|uniref:Uncharacterized protein n=1 Tax=Candidatus Daviesbacteria bacterium RIFOXYD1_FULL_41_10 TaxID=1797801 RepID=A0A1F5MZH8_9BACT|nr:MAG: hypothetical protein A2617_01740 [Candidatus Daviesbacteria bacterium RIFOXYD1_FULL_41_10]
MGKEQFQSLLILSEPIVITNEDENVELGQVDLISKGGVYIPGECDEWLTHATLPYLLAITHFYEN